MTVHENIDMIVLIGSGGESSKKVEIHKTEVYTLKEAAKFLKVSEATIRRRMRDGSLPSLKTGRIRRIRGQEILNLIEKSMENGVK